MASDAQNAVFGAGLDFTPVVGDIKGFVDAYNEPTFSNVAAAVVGLVPGVGDVAGKVIKTGSHIAKEAKNVEKAAQGPRYATGKLREQVMDKGRQADGTVKCAYCDKPTATASDHIDPYSKGGSTTLDNLNPACTSCNSSKRSKELGTEWIPPKDRKP